MVNIFLPSFNTAILPQAAFEQVINKIGSRVSWQQAHVCLCARGGSASLNNPVPVEGTPDPNCQSCYGLGTYWDDPSAPFVALVTQMNATRTPNEMGVDVDDTIGEYIAGSPSLTVPYASPDNPSQPLAAWQYGSTNDIYIEVDAQAKYTAYLQNGVTKYLPIQTQINVPPTGAVRVYNSATNQTVQTNDYAVSGATIVLGNDYPLGTPFSVEFFASPYYVAYKRAGGFPHVRPLGAGTSQEPRRFQLMTLDVWLRANQQTNRYSAGPPTVAINAPLVATLTGQVKVG